MKVAKKTIGAVIAALALFSMAGCAKDVKPGDKPGESDPELQTPVEDEYVPLTTEFATYYLNIADADYSGLEGFHFKNITTEVVGIEFQKIFASDTKSEDGATVIYDFTAGSAADDCKVNAYWGFGAGSCDGTKWSSGEVDAVPEGEDEVYITGFASAGFVDAAYVGVVVKNLSDTVKGDDVLFVPILSGNPDTEKQLTFKELFNK